MAGVKKQTAEVLNSNRKAEELLNQKIEKLQREANDLEQRVQELQKTKKENTPSVLGYILGYPQRVVAAQIKQLEEKLKNDVQTCTEKEKRILEIEVAALKELLVRTFSVVEANIKSGTVRLSDVNEFKQACVEINNYVSPQKPVQDNYLVQGTKALLSLFKANQQPQPITAQQNQQNPQSSWTDTLLCRRRQVNEQQGQQEGL